MLLKFCTRNTQQQLQNWKKSVYISIPEKCNAKECSNYRTIALISHASKVMLKILQARLQKYVNWELSDVKAGFGNGRETRDQIANIRWIIEKVREFPKSIYFCFIDYTKAFDCMDHNKVENSWRDGSTDHLTCLLGNLYAGQEVTVRTRQGSMDWFKIGKGECQGCILSPSLFNLYAEYIMQNAGLAESQTRIKIARRINNHRKWRGAKALLEECERRVKKLD